MKYTDEDFEMMARIIGSMRGSIISLHAQLDVQGNMIRDYIGKKSPEMVPELARKAQEDLIKITTDLLTNSPIEDEISQADLDRFFARFSTNPPKGHGLN